MKSEVDVVIRLISEFEAAAGLNLTTWLSIVFAIYSYLMARSIDELIANPGLFIIHRERFISESTVSQADMDGFLIAVSTPFDELGTPGTARPVDARLTLFLSGPCHFFLSRPTSLIASTARFSWRRCSAASTGSFTTRSRGTAATISSTRGAGFLSTM